MELKIESKGVYWGEVSVLTMTKEYAVDLGDGLRSVSLPSCVFDQ